MEEQYELTAIVPLNYKNGKYIAGAYKKRDFLILVSAAVFSFIIFFGFGLSSILMMITAITLLGCTAIMLLPMKHYQALYRYLIIKLQFLRKEKEYQYGGFYGYIYKQEGKKHKERN